MLIQRISQASVTVEDQEIATADRGLLVFVGIGYGDGDEQRALMVDKLLHLRVFSDGENRMNNSLIDVTGDLLVVPQFTLYADLSQGRRPGFGPAASPTPARQQFEQFVRDCRTHPEVQQHGIRVEAGAFGAHMQVRLLNNGPVTFWLDSADYLDSSTY